MRSNETVAYPNLMFHFLPVAVRYDGSAPQGHGYQVHVGPMYSDARGIGQDHLDRSAHAPGPALQLPHAPSRTAANGSRPFAARGASSPRRPSTRSTAARSRRAPSVETDEEILAWVARDAETALHPSCTCRMGVGEDSVIDPASMRVHGLDGIRVVDASALRYVTNGNIYAPTMMVAEKSADMILGNTPLAADHGRVLPPPAPG